MLAPLMEGRASEMEVRFPWPQPSYVSRLREALAAQVAFGGKELSLSVPLGLCAEPLPFADVRLHASAIAELESTSGRIHESNRLLLKLQDLLSRKRRGRLNEEEAALELGMSRRTLVRRLSESGTSFRQLLDAELKARARGLLDEGRLSRSEMADALGFDDPTSFSRACRRWFGEARL
jgi:AraC-like DNA-binding protein